MVNEKLIIPEENIYKTEEVRYLENQELKTKKPTEKDFFVSSPGTYGELTSEEKEAQKKDAVNLVGSSLEVVDVLAPPLGGIATAFEEAAGRTTGVLGEITDNEELKDAGEVHTKIAEKPFKDIGKVAKEVKKIFE